MTTPRDERIAEIRETYFRNDHSEEAIAIRFLCDELAKRDAQHAELQAEADSNFVVAERLAEQVNDLEEGHAASLRLVEASLGVVGAARRYADYGGATQARFCILKTELAKHAKALAACEKENADIECEKCGDTGLVGIDDVVAKNVPTPVFRLSKPCDCGKTHDETEHAKENKDA